MIYDNWSLYVSNYLKKSKRSAVLECTGAYKDTSHTTLMEELSWSPLTSRRSILNFASCARSLVEHVLHMFMGCFLLKDLTDTMRFEMIANWNNSEYELIHTGNHFCHPQRDYGIVSHLNYASIHPMMLSKKPWSEISSQSQSGSSLTVREKDLSIMQGLKRDLVL